MVKRRWVIRILAFVLTVGLIGGGLAFVDWPWSSKEKKEESQPQSPGTHSQSKEDQQSIEVYSPSEEDQQSLGTFRPSEEEDDNDSDEEEEE